MGADARLYVDDQPSPLPPTARRTFITPPLEAGRTFAYMIRVEGEHNGQPVTRSERVLVRAGQVSRVDFGDRGGVANR